MDLILRIRFCHLDGDDNAGHVGEERRQPDHTLVIVIGDDNDCGKGGGGDGGDDGGGDGEGDDGGGNGGGGTGGGDDGGDDGGGFVDEHKDCNHRLKMLSKHIIINSTLMIVIDDHDPRHHLLPLLGIHGLVHPLADRRLEESQADVCHHQSPFIIIMIMVINMIMMTMIGKIMIMMKKDEDKVFYRHSKRCEDQ